ncbi:MAG: shikimate dehydrogenase [Cyanobacteria bacterium HKST-UBA02]|nr:shikimate dehydrogenase [Cyanobacteria bacterium HKST-UBA02]
MTRAYQLGLIGYPVGHSLSPRLHRAALSSAGLQGDYQLLAVAPQDLDEFLSRLRLAGASYQGLNVTIPHKQAVIPHMDELSPSAASAGAVNTIMIREDRLVGHNTDIHGFKTGLESAGLSPDRRRIAIVLGAGGAARAAILGLAELAFAEIVVAARDRSKTRDLVAGFGQPDFPATVRAADLDGLAGSSASVSADLLVNATPLGQSAEPTFSTPIWFERALGCLGEDGLFYDLVYARESTGLTPLVEAARKRGLPAVDGMVMLVHQAAAAFELWTGKKPDTEAMREAAYRS